MEERNHLREELVSFQTHRQTTVNILYTGVSAILAVGISIEQSLALIFLVPFCVIIPTYVMVLDYTHCIMKIGTYLQVFHDDPEYKWEARSWKLNESLSRTMKMWRNSCFFPFYILSFISLGLFCLYFDFTIEIQGMRTVELVICAVLFVTTVIVTISHKTLQRAKKTIYENGLILPAKRRLSPTKALCQLLNNEAKSNYKHKYYYKQK